MNLEDDLRRALTRQPAPDGFADRVIGRVEADRVGRTVRARPARLPAVARLWRATAWSRRSAKRGGGEGSSHVRSSSSPVMRWLAAAAAVALVAAGGARYDEYQQNVAEAKRVEAEIRLAMQITSETLARVQAKLQETNR